MGDWYTKALSPVVDTISYISSGRTAAARGCTVYKDRLSMLYLITKTAKTAVIHKYQPGNIDVGRLIYAKSKIPLSL